jgi:hypothetical protein
MLVAMAVITYFIPYLLLFASFRLPGGTRTLLRSRASGFYLPLAPSFRRSFLRRTTRIPPLPFLRL